MSDIIKQLIEELSKSAKPQDELCECGSCKDAVTRAAVSFGYVNHNYCSLYAVQVGIAMSLLAECALTGVCNKTEADFESEYLRFRNSIVHALKSADPDKIAQLMEGSDTPIPQPVVDKYELDTLRLAIRQAYDYCNDRDENSAFSVLSVAVDYMNTIDTGTKTH